MCPPERLRDHRSTQGQPTTCHIEKHEAFDGPPPSMKRRISDTFLAVRDFAVTVLEARAEQAEPNDDVSQR